MKTSEFIDGVSECADQIQTLIPEVLTRNQLVFWTAALLRTATELSLCGDFEREAVVDMLNKFFDQIETMDIEQQKVH